MESPDKTPVKENTTKLKPKPQNNFFSNLTFFFIKIIFGSTQNVIGIDIGSGYIKVVQLQKIGKSYTVVNCITRAVPQVVKDNVEEKKKLVKEIIKSFIADTRIKTNLGRLVIWGKGIFVLNLTAPVLNKKDLKGAVSIDLKKRLPFQTDIDSIIFDFFVTGQAVDEKGAPALQVCCIAANRVFIDEQVRFLKEMDIRPVSINVIPDALGSLLPFCVEVSADKTVAILDMGANASLLNFYKGKNLIFSREIPIAGDHLTRAMVKSITTPAGVISINFEEAEKIKRNCGIPLEEEAASEYFTDFGALRGEQISTMLRPSLERLVMEINRTFMYYTSAFKSRTIEELYLTGGTSRMKNIDKFLLYNLPGLKKAESLNILKSVKGWTNKGAFRQEFIMEQAAPHLSSAFGICLSTGGKVNLLPAIEKVEQRAIFVVTLVRIMFPFLLLVFLGFYIFQYFSAIKYNILASQTEAEISKLEPVAKYAREFVSMKNRIEQRASILEKAKGRQPLWWGMLKELSNSTPKEVLLKEIITIDTEEPKKIKLVGKIFAKFTIVDLALSQYLVALDDSPFFSNVELLGSKTDMYSVIPAAEFEISCTLNY